MKLADVAKKYKVDIHSIERWIPKFLMERKERSLQIDTTKKL